VDLFYGHGMISQPAYQAISAACGDWINPPNSCFNLADDAINQVGNIDIYNVYDVCGNDNLQAVTESTALRAPNSQISKLKDPLVCVPTALSTAYMNDATVRAALHVSNSKLSSWGECYNIRYNTNIVSLLPIYPKLIANMNVLIYSGDADACVPWNGSYNWTRNLGITETLTWQPWMVNSGGNSWTGGFVTQWGKNFSYITIKHAGHMVPQFEPEAALTFYTAFLKGTIPQ